MGKTAKWFVTDSETHTKQQLNNGTAFVKSFIVFRLISKEHSNSKTPHKDLEIIQKGKDIPANVIEVYGGVEVELQLLLTLSLETREWSISTPSALHTVDYSAPMELEAGWAPQSVWNIWRREKCQITAGIRTRDCVVCIIDTRLKFFALWTKVYKLVPVLAILTGPHTHTRTHTHTQPHAHTHSHTHTHTLFRDKFQHYLFF